jgi:hypothetical protein
MARSADAGDAGAHDEYVDMMGAHATQPLWGII